VFKNGRIYEGTFENDHILEFPTFDMDGVTTPDITKIRTRTPLPSGRTVDCWRHVILSSFVKCVVMRSLYYVAAAHAYTLHGGSVLCSGLDRCSRPTSSLVSTAMGNCS